MARAPKSELKALDLAEQLTGFTLAGVFTTVNVPVNGAELYQRVGRKIYMKSLHIRGFLVNNSTGVQDYGRILVVYDSQPNGATPVLATLLQDSNAGAATTGLSNLNLANRARFKILRDYPVLLPSVTNTAGVLTNFQMTDQIKSSFNIDMFIKLKGLETEFNGTNGGTIADINSGSIFILTASTLANNGWEFEFQTRLRYYD